MPALRFRRSALIRQRSRARGGVRGYRLSYARGAAHLQIGRTYAYRDALTPPALGLLRAIKAAVDPLGLMNPGVLGLP
jgi:FAD/FMN-containing dehydrogenase